MVNIVWIVLSIFSTALSIVLIILLIRTSIRYEDQILIKFSELEETFKVGDMDCSVCKFKTNLPEKLSEEPSENDEVLNCPDMRFRRTPFDFIHKTDPLHLLNLIQQEHPQIIALILSYLEPNKASVILENLPFEKQSDVARRIATMDRTSPEILREIERVLEKKLSMLSSEDYTVAGGVETIVEILNLVDRATEKQIIEVLEDEDPELAEEIKKRMFVFEDIIMLDNTAIQKVFREVDSQELAKALKSVDTEVQDKIFKNLSDRAAAMLKEDMEYIGPVRLKDVEEAQQKIVSIIRRLEEEGEIIIARSGEDELII